MNRFVKLGGCAALLALVGTGAQAAELSYTNADFGYSRVDFDDAGEDADGLFLRGSYALNDQLFAIAGYRELSMDVGPADVDLDQFDIGVGLRLPIDSRMDFVGKLAYTDISADGPGSGGFDDDGLILSAGVRASLLPEVEVEGAIEYRDLDVLGDDLGLRVGGRYYFTKLFSAGAELGYSDDVTEFGLYGRFTF